MSEGNFNFLWGILDLGGGRFSRKMRPAAILLPYLPFAWKMRNSPETSTELQR